MARRNRAMAVRQADRLRLFNSRWRQAFVVLLVVLWLVLPLNLNDFWLDVLARCGIAAIGAIGLNILTGYTGQISLGQAFFLGVGVYAGAWFGVRQDLPLLVWLPLAAIVGGVIGAAIGPFALRLRGNYLAIVTLGLLYVGDHVFTNWDTLTGGSAGTDTSAPVSIGPLDFSNLKLGAVSYTRSQGLFWLIWLIAGIVVLLALNLVRTRPGRAMQAVRDRDVAAEIIGVSLTRYKIGAFAVASALAAMAGGLFGVVQQFSSPGIFGGAPGLALSITYVAMIIVGGIGTIGGSVVGALVVAGLPRVIERVSQNTHIPFVKGSGGDPSGFLSVFALNQLIFGLLIIGFLLIESRGLAAVWARVKAYFSTWPFRY
jgi:branched-chain amino acid transport system permease protein